MTLIIRHIRLRVQTESGMFGTDIPLTIGLNILWADNTKGKSTALQGLLYALGLERMLSARRNVPLPHVMTSYVEENDDDKHKVIESAVWIELENNKGQIITIRRFVVNATGGDTRLVSVFEGALLTGNTLNIKQRDYFVLDPGSAQRESGFHNMFASFLGWTLPTVGKYEGGEALLYLEAIFPLFFVEQKTGWSAIPASFPTMFQIREVGKRALEFVLALETHEIELKRQQLEAELANNKHNWTSKRSELQTIASSIDAKMQGVPLSPISSLIDIEISHLIIPNNKEWMSVQDLSSFIRVSIRALSQRTIPTVESVAVQAAGTVEPLTLQVAELNTSRAAIFRGLNFELAQKRSINARLLALKEDLQKNLDAQKLKNFGSSLVETLTAHLCPTCSQPISDALLEQENSPEIMSIEDNINYIKSQVDIFKQMLENTDTNISIIELSLAEATREVNAVSAQLRAIKADLVAPSNSPSIAILEERIRLESRLELLEKAYQKFEKGKADLIEIARQNLLLLQQKTSLPKGGLTGRDKEKINQLATLFREQAKEYKFTTFSPAELEISDESYRPQKEGFDIGFEISASDGIRLKWAYQLALLEMSRTHPTNHIGVVVFDEPRQQEASKLSFQNLLKRASTAKKAKQQVIFATSEDLQQLRGFLTGTEHNLLEYQGRMIKRL